MKDADFFPHFSLSSPPAKESSAFFLCVCVWSFIGGSDCLCFVFIGVFVTTPCPCAAECLCLAKQPSPLPVPRMCGEVCVICVGVMSRRSSKTGEAPGAMLCRQMRQFGCERGGKCCKHTITDVYEREREKQTGHDSKQGLKDRERCCCDKELPAFPGREALQHLDVMLNTVRRLGCCLCFFYLVCWEGGRKLPCWSVALDARGQDVASFSERREGGERKNHNCINSVSLCQS